MLAVIKIGGLQHIVQKGDVIKVNKLTSEVGSTIEINEVLSIIDGKNVKFGNPLVVGSSVSAKILEQKKDKKVIVFKKRRRQNSRRKNGHRQQITKIEILEIK
jgi:large subunit ribosomal protein L21